jgi:hypothetical protein
MTIIIGERKFDINDVQFDLCTKDGYKTILYDGTIFLWTNEEFINN